MKTFAFAACLAVVSTFGISGCNRGGPRYEEHQQSSDVGETDQPHVGEAAGGDGSGATGTGGTAPSEPDVEGKGDPDTASDGDSSN